MQPDAVHNDVRFALALLFCGIFKVDHQWNAVAIEDIPLRNVHVADTRVVYLHERTDDLDSLDDVISTIYSSKRDEHT